MSNCCPTKKYIPAVTSTPTVNENETGTSKSVFEPDDSSVVDNEVQYNKLFFSCGLKSHFKKGNKICEM